MYILGYLVRQIALVTLKSKYAHKQWKIIMKSVDHIHLKPEIGNISEGKILVRFIDKMWSMHLQSKICLEF